jgi:hypothetical protein
MLSEIKREKENLALFFTSLFGYLENGDICLQEEKTVFLMKWNSGISMHLMIVFFFKILKLNSFSYFNSCCISRHIFVRA